MRFLGSLLFIGLIGLGSCSTVRYVEPLDKGEHAVSAGIGGPVIDFGGIPFLIPLSNVGYGYGLDSNLTVHGGLHTTSLLFHNLQVDAGVTWQPFESSSGWIPNLSVTPAFNFIYDFDSPNSKLWPSLDINGFWNYGEKDHYIYTGVGNWFELQSERSGGRESLRQWIPSVQVGTVLKSDKFRFGFEAKWLGINAQVDYSFVDFKPINSPGAYGLYFNVARRF